MGYVRATSRLRGEKRGPNLRSNRPNASGTTAKGAARWPSLSSAKQDNRGRLLQTGQARQRAWSSCTWKLQGSE